VNYFNKQKERIFKSTSQLTSYLQALNKQKSKGIPSSLIAPEPVDLTTEEIPSFTGIALLVWKLQQHADSLQLMVICGLIA
jgi:hypothetical protein